MSKCTVTQVEVSRLRPLIVTHFPCLCSRPDRFSHSQTYVSFSVTRRHAFSQTISNPTPHSLRLSAIQPTFTQTFCNPLIQTVCHPANIHSDYVQAQLPLHCSESYIMCVCFTVHLYAKCVLIISASCPW